MGKASILVIEDDLDIQQLVSYNLIKAGFNVSCADSGEEGLQVLQNESIDLLLLDLMLPGKDGMEICTMIRKKAATASMPIVMMTAKGEEEDIVSGLAAGADDYVPKPFSPKILIARIQAVLRRRQEKKNAEQKPADEKIIYPSLVIHPGRYEVLVEGKQVHLTTTEFTILEQLASRPGWVFSRRQLIDAIRGYDYLITPRAIDVQIFGLRKKMGQLGSYIETVRGVGYRFKTEEEEEQ
ncbi:MAG TPA: response regulator transcription factor [Desulfobulbus sp.]|nr:response regulator transcription factor [Desulfobulbus sp.]HHD62813.1 response regulator transcription factor [Desulfobulbaceae bacterium]